MKPIHSQQSRLLSITLSSRGVGYAVLEGEQNLVDWGNKFVKREDKNNQSLAKVEELISQYEPDCLVMLDVNVKGSRHSKRIRALSQQIVAQAASLKLKTILVSSKQVRRFFFDDGQGTKDALAKIVAEQFPEELVPRLPPKRRLWKSEDARMDYFEAVAVALTFYLKKPKQTGILTAAADANFINN